MIHKHTNEISWSRRLIIVMIMNLIVPLLQIYAGIISGSMALISDAIHNLSDFVSILISYIALKIGHRPPDPKQTFGYKRVEVFAAVLNVSLLFVVSFFIVFEAWKHLINPKPIKGGLVMGVAALAFSANAVSTLLLHGGARKNINIRSAFLHMLTDTLISFGIIVLGCIWIFRPWYWLDSIITWVIVSIIFYNGWGIVKEAFSILMNAAPSSIDINVVKKKIEAIKGVLGVHHLHVWNISSDIVALSTHIIVQDQMVSKLENLATKIRKVLLCDFNVTHPTLQFECKPYEATSLLCSKAKDTIEDEIESH